MATPEEKEAKKRKAFFVRLPPAVLDQLKRETERRGVSQSGMVELMIAQASSGAAIETADVKVLEAAAAACIAALDLVKNRVLGTTDKTAILRAAARLEDFLELLAQGGRQ